MDVAILYSDKLNYKPKLIKRSQSLGGRVSYILAIRMLKQEEITAINVYTANSSTPNFIKQLLLEIKGQIKINTILLGDLNIPITQTNKKLI